MSMFQVPDQVIQQADRCGYGHSCLEIGKCGSRPLCKVDSSLNHQLSFLNTKESAACNYRILFGGKQLCMCPVRTFIFEHYEQ